MPDFMQTVVIPASTQTVTIPEKTITATITVDLTNLRTLLRLAGWSDGALDVGQAIAVAESGGRDTTTGATYAYADAVGDVSLTTPVWGPSIGLFQIRSLRYPMVQYQSTDIWRQAWPLRQPFYNAQAAWVLSKNGTDFTLWSVYGAKTYEQYLGGDPVIRTGYATSGSWLK